MVKTTVYLPDPLKQAIERAAARRRVSEAEVIRQTLADGLEAAPPAPRGALFRSGTPSIAERVDELLAEGFGE
jgi:hypothetical protein